MGVIIGGCLRELVESRLNELNVEGLKTLSPLKTPSTLAFIPFLSCISVKRALVFPAIGPQASRSQGHALFMPTSPTDPEAELAEVWAPVTTEKVPALSPPPATLLARHCVPPHPSSARSIC